MSFAQRDTLNNLAKKQGITTKEFCKRAVAKYGTAYKAAAKLGVYENAIRYHLNKPDPATTAVVIDADPQ